MLSRKRTLFAAAALGLAGVAAGIGPAQAAETEVVREADIVRQPHNTPPTNEWVLYTRDTGTGAFVVGPEDAPLGQGSLHLTTTTGNDKVYLFNYEHIGTDLDDVDAIGYSTYRDSGNLQQVTALNLQVDVNGPGSGGFTTLVFEPVYNTDQGAVVDDEWQDWDAINGGDARWWSTANIPGVCSFDCFVAWEDILAANPDAVIVGGVGVNQGGGNPNLDAYTDAFTFNETTYDFEPTANTPPSKDACKKGGWMTYQDSNFQPFKNQGDCVSSVASKNK